MQTFLPYPSFRRSMASLDRARLGKQRVEAYQMLCGLKDPWATQRRLLTKATSLSRAWLIVHRPGWTNHPATRMWEGFADALGALMNVAIEEWEKRGYRNTMPLRPLPPSFKVPHWWGDERVHESHRANLIRKDPDHYGPQFPGVTPTEGYYWPVQKEVA